MWQKQGKPVQFLKVLLYSVLFFHFHALSRKENLYVNAVAENFFSILKTECVYRHKAATFSEADRLIDRYIYFYNLGRIQLKTGETSC